MKEIKFRAWNKIWKMMSMVDKIEFEDGNPYSVSTTIEATDFDHTDEWSDYEVGDEIILQQFTGLKDKNGKDIWEGDIIKQEFDGKTWIYEIIIPNTGTQNFYRICRYRDFRTDEYGQYEYGNFYLQENTGELHESKDYEVIGNIFENPELIK